MLDHIHDDQGKSGSFPFQLVNILQQGIQLLLNQNKNSQLGKEHTHQLSKVHNNL